MFQPFKELALSILWVVVWTVFMGCYVSFCLLLSLSGRDPLVVIYRWFNPIGPIPGVVEEGKWWKL